MRGSLPTLPVLKDMNDKSRAQPLVGVTSILPGSSTESSFPGGVLEFLPGERNNLGM